MQTIHFYRRCDTGAVMASGDKLSRNPFPFDLDYVGRMHTELTVSRVRALLSRGVPHTEIYSKYRCEPSEAVPDAVPLQKVYIYQSPDAKLGVKVTCEEREGQAILTSFDTTDARSAVKDVRLLLRDGMSLDDVIDIYKKGQSFQTAS